MFEYIGLDIIVRLKWNPVLTIQRWAWGSMFTVFSPHRHNQALFPSVKIYFLNKLTITMPTAGPTKAQMVCLSMDNQQLEKKRKKLNLTGQSISNFSICIWSRKQSKSKQNVWLLFDFISDNRNSTPPRQSLGRVDVELERVDFQCRNLWVICIVLIAFLSTPCWIRIAKYENRFSNLVFVP